MTLKSAVAWAGYYPWGETCLWSLHCPPSLGILGCCWIFALCWLFLFEEGPSPSLHLRAPCICFGVLRSKEAVCQGIFYSTYFVVLFWAAAAPSSVRVMTRHGPVFREYSELAFFHPSEDFVVLVCLSIVALFRKICYLCGSQTWNLSV